MNTLNLYFSGLNAPGNLKPVVSYVYDPTIGISGVYRPQVATDGAAALSTAPAGEGTGLGAVFAPASRNEIFIQNVGVNPIYVALSGTASPTNYNFILEGGTVPQDGKGGEWSSDAWKGGLSVSGSGIAYAAYQF